MASDVDYGFICLPAWATEAMLQQRKHSAPKAMLTTNVHIELLNIIKGANNSRRYARFAIFLFT